MNYIIHYDICAVVISLFAVAFLLSKKGFRQNQNIVLFVLFCVSAGAALLDIIGVVVNSAYVAWPQFAKNIVNYAYYLLQNAMPYLLCCYILEVVSISLKYGRAKAQFMGRILSIPWVICCLILVLNLFVPIVFYYNDAEEYCHGPGLYVLYGLAFLYMVLCFYLVIHFGKNVSRSLKNIVIVLEAASFLAVFVQMLIPVLHIQLFVESLCLVGTLFTVENEAEIVDSITTCYNRQKLFTDINYQLDSKEEYVIILVRIPDIETYNTSFGMNKITRIMRNVGLWFRHLCKGMEVYSYDLGSFALLCDDRVNRTEIIEKVKKHFSDAFILDNSPIKFRTEIDSLRVGIDFKSVDQLMVYVTNDKNSFGSDSSKSSLDKVADLRFELVMQRAIERSLQFDEFEVKLQPIWNAKENKITDAEALVSLYDDADGLIPAESFIPYAERKGYIVEISEYVFESVCRFIATHDINKIGIEKVHINLSSYQFLNEMFVTNTENIRKKYSVPASVIAFELSGNGMSENFNNIKKHVRELRSKGYTFVLDNYGKHAMNMNYLLDLRFDYIKIDKSFFWKAEDDLKANIYFANTMRMAKEMNLKIIVLGVEHVAQKSLLQNYDCDYLQGFYYQKALSMEEFYRYCVGFNSKN